MIGIVVLGTLVTGLSEPWLWATAICVILAVTVRYEIRSWGLCRFRGSFVDPSDFDPASLGHLAAVQGAIATVLGSLVYREGRLGRCSARRGQARP